MLYLHNDGITFLPQQLTMKNIVIGILSLAVIALAIMYLTGNKTGTFYSQECKSPIAQYEDPTRIPLRNFLLEELGDISGQTIVDIGAGPGFFAFEYAHYAEKVIATEIDQTFLDYMREKTHGELFANVEVVEARDDHKELSEMNADLMYMVFVFHFIENPRHFLQEIAKGLRPGGRLFIANAQMSPVIIRDYLEQAGFEEIGTSHFTYTQPGGCGDIEVQLVKAMLPDDAQTMR